MGADLRFDSAIAQFAENPLTRSWPEPPAIDALFRYCTKRFMETCRADPRSWLTSQDLSSLLAQTLREELPRHGLPACAVHQGYPCYPQHRNEPGKTPRAGLYADIGLLIPDSIMFNDNQGEGTLVLAAAIRLGYAPGAMKDDLAKLKLLREKLPHMLVYMVVMGYQDDQSGIDAARQAAEEADIALLADNYTGLEIPVTQDKLL